MEISKETRKIACEEIKRFFSEERDENIGDLAADLILDFFSKKLGYMFYNEGVKDSVRLVNERMQAMEVDLYSLEKRS